MANILTYPMSKKIILLLFIAGTFQLFTSLKSSDYNVVGYFNGSEARPDTYSLTKDDEIIETKLILVPQQMPKGKYVVNVTRIAKDLYKIDKKIDGKNIYIQTKSCYEFAIDKQVALTIENSYGYSKGKVIF
jgi:hypothetical protein